MQRLETKANDDNARGATDVNWDSFVLLDNFRWGCGEVGGSAHSVTEHAG